MIIYEVDSLTHMQFLSNHCGSENFYFEFYQHMYYFSSHT